MKKGILIGLMILGALVSRGQQSFELPLYPGGPAESNGIEAPEGGGEEWVTGVREPRLYVYLPGKEKATGRAVVICPGGGYQGLALEKEGREVARWLNGQGVAAVVLKYRMPNGHHQIPLKDAQTALETVRAHAAEWGVDSLKVGIMGFSAGGHLASTAATHFTTEGNRPDFAVLIYPVITMNETFTHKGSRNSLLGKQPDTALLEKYSNELQVTDRTPPVFIATADDDKGVPTSNSVRFYLALQESGVPGELHIYPHGGHGWGGFRDSFPYWAEFQASLARWLGELK